MAPRFQLSLFWLPFLCFLFGIFIMLVIENCFWSPRSAKSGTRCVCLAVLTSTTVHRLQLGFNHGHHSHPRGSSISGCYQHDDKQQEWAPGQQLLWVKSGVCTWLILALLLLTFPSTHLSHLKAFCVSSRPREDHQNDTILEKGISKTSSSTCSF